MRWYLQSSRTNITDKQFTKSLSTAGTLVSLTLGQAPGHGKEEGEKRKGIMAGLCFWKGR